MGQSVHFILLLTTILLLALANNTAANTAAFSEHLTDKQILDILIHPQRYDKRTKPLAAPLHVNVSVMVLSLSSPDESSLHYDVEFLMHQEWVDPRLAYADRKEGRPYLNALAHHAHIWKPDIYLLKHGTFKGITPTEVALRIYPTGRIFYTFRRHLVLNCEGDLHIFPFDSPMCTFSLESISSTRAQMEFHWVPGPDWGGAASGRANGSTGGGGPAAAPASSITLSPVLKMHNAYLIHNETLLCEGEEWRGDFSCLKVKLHFTRDKWFYYTTVFVPGLILVTSSFVTFWIEWNAEPARVMLGVTTMLNFFTTSNKFRSKLPVVSNLTAMNMWDGVCMFFIYASFLEFIVVNYLARWVQDPETQKQKRENAILDSLRIVTTTLDMKHPQNAGTLGGQLHHLGGNLETRLKVVKHKMPAELVQRLPAHGKSTCGGGGEKNAEKTTTTTTSALGLVPGEKGDVTELAGSDAAAGAGAPEVPSLEVLPEAPAAPPSGYTLNSVKKIDNVSRRIFPTLYILFVLYFFIRYHHIEGALSVH